jgi:hypothetical protein
MIRTDCLLEPEALVTFATEYRGAEQKREQIAVSRRIAR